MRRVWIILLIGSIFLLGNTEVLVAQATLKGKIVDVKTGEPLTGVHVFLSGTTTGTATNPKGQYLLQNISEGSYWLIISRIGYKREKINLNISPGEIKILDFKLNPVVYEMPEIFVGDLDKKWEKNLKWFTELFIGSSETADSVIILNPEVLRFESKWWGKLTAEALTPLKIENRALGYQITYYLDEFTHSGSRTKWDGEPVFSEMIPADSMQADYWKRNREKAFNGSLRHFLLSVLQDRVEEQGFRTSIINDNAYKFKYRNRRPVKAKRLIKEGDEPFLYSMSFFGRLEIIYVRAEEDWRFIDWTREHRRSPAGVQTSYLELNERPISIDIDGEIIEPYGATQIGYFAFERLADATPRSYRPQLFLNSD